MHEAELHEHTVYSQESATHLRTQTLHWHTCSSSFPPIKREPCLVCLFTLVLLPIRRFLPSLPLLSTCRTRCVTASSWKVERCVVRLISVRCRRAGIGSIVGRNGFVRVMNEDGHHDGGNPAAHSANLSCKSVRLSGSEEANVRTREGIEGGSCRRSTRHQSTGPKFA